MKRYSIGVDFGSLSARSVVLDLETGEIVAQAVSPYLHGILTEQLPDGTPLGSDWALQVPADYHLALFDTVRESVKLAHIPPCRRLRTEHPFVSCLVLRPSLMPI